MVCFLFLYAIPTRKITGSIIGVCDTCSYGLMLCIIGTYLKSLGVYDGEIRSLLLIINDILHLNKVVGKNGCLRLLQFDVFNGVTKKRNTFT
jgi:hypothetical protein